MAQGHEKVVLSFAGQGVIDLDDLARLYHRSAVVRETVQTATQCLQQMALRPEARWSGTLGHGIALESWLREPSKRPSRAYLESPLISQLIIFVHQISRYRMLYQEGLSEAFLSGAISAITGHSQGILPALLIGQSAGGAIEQERFDCTLRYLFWQGMSMAMGLASLPQGPEGTSPMASITGPSQARLSQILARLNQQLPPAQQLVISLYNTSTRHVVSGAPTALSQLHEVLTGLAEREAKKKQAGKLGGKALSFQWEYLDTAGPYHSQSLAEGLAMMREKVADEGFRISSAALQYDVYSPATAQRYNDLQGDFLDQLMQEQFVLPVQWQQTVQQIGEMSKPSFWLDLGPGDGVLRLAYANLKGMGTMALSVADQRSEDNFFAARPVLPNALDYKTFQARIDTSTEHPVGAAMAVDNRYTRTTGMAPVILPGMTPTTSDVPIVAAAANAGYTAELAGGGQVTEAIFWTRMDELKAALEPGREVVFNALYMDRYLWDLHLGKTDLVCKARRAGYPICGVTVSAGLPEVDEAVALLDKWVEHGIWLNAFKPGTMAQIKQVTRIAQAAPHHTIFVHLEGGKAGGHHSWESLDDLLLDGYHTLREQPNVVLCVGGGIGGPDRAVELLQGTWSLAYDRPMMPVDAVFIGTLAMASLEACTSPQVKQALVDAKGGPEWVYTGKAAGDMTSGKSQLNADIHYIDNPAAQCGRLLDQVAGDAAAVEARRDEIIATLNATAKPYFGELEQMSYSQVAARLFELLAIGRDGTYEDGRWLDVTYRRRCFDFLRRAEARLTPQQQGAFASLFPSLASLDDPQEAFQRFVEGYPPATSTLMHPADIAYFINEICARPGKPVNFVPVIDANVRRWYKSDSLWQAHDDRYEADQVLIIPGPEAVQGIDRVDEPIAEILGKINDALGAALTPQTSWKREATSRPAWPSHLRVRQDGSTTILEVRSTPADDATSWLRATSCRFDGPVARMLATSHIHVGERPKINPLHQICQAHVGAQLHLECGDATEASDGAANELTAIHYFGGEQTPGIGVACCSLQLVKGQDDADQPSSLLFSLQTPSTSPNQTVLLQYPLTERIDIQGQFVAAQAEYDVAVRDYYLSSMAIPQRPDGDILSPMHADITIESGKARGYAVCTGHAYGPTKALPLNMAFSVVWKPLMQLLTHDELAGGLLDLVHLDNEITPGPGWPMAAGEEVEVHAQIVSIEDKANGRVVRTCCHIQRGAERCGTVESGFMIRGDFGKTRCERRESRDVTTTIALQDKGTIDFFLDHDWHQLDAASLQPGAELRIVATVKTEKPRGEKAHYTAKGALYCDGARISDITLDQDSEALEHPLLACLNVLQEADATRARRDVPATPLARAMCEAPSDLTGFAAASGDHNPIHQSDMAAHLAALDGPIVHGMWTAARLHSFLVKEIAAGQASRVTGYQAQFLAPIMPGESLRMEASRIATEGGLLVTQVVASIKRDGQWQPALQAEAKVAPPTTAYIFPGQGIQQAQMGMDGYARSAAARAVWDRADAFTREQLGFSILHIVRENPKELLVKGTPNIHPKGVLHLTQFTQVAMAVLAQAQVAELQEASLLAPDAVICGHSVGEYNAIGAMGILPLEDIVSIVYQRGMVMHKFVPRDATGESGYRMGVLRPHYAAMDHQAAEALVKQIAEESGKFIEIVNYNVRDRQYAVTGEFAALELLQQAVEARATGGKPPYLEVPGIDVPFHSSRLRGGVDQFRQTLERCLPQEIDLDRLCGKYIPNLVPRPFTLDVSFIQEMIDVTGSESLQALLDQGQHQTMTPHELGRRLLIELLAWQFTSPVRWIETQELMLAPAHKGGLGVERVIEIGVGYQPTLANMARYTLRLMGPTAPQVEVLNAGAETDQVFHKHQVKVPEWPAEAEEMAESAQEASRAPQASNASGPASMVLSAASREALQAAQQAAPAVPAQPAPQPVAASADTSALQGPLPVVDALHCLLALQARVRPEQIDPKETLDDLFAGVSSRRNQVLLDLGAEFATTPIDGAHEMPLEALAETLSSHCQGYKGPGPYLKRAQEEAIKQRLGAHGLSRKALLDYLSSEYQMGDGWGQASLNQWMLETREGKSARGGGFGADGVESNATFGSKSDGWTSLDAAVQSLGQRRGIHVAKVAQQGGGSAQAVDAAVVNELEAKILGPKGILAESARQMLHALEPQANDATDASAHSAEAAAKLALYEAEFDPQHHELLQPRFAAAKHVAFTAAWATLRRDISALYFNAANGVWDEAQIDAAITRLSRVCKTPGLQKTAAWYAGRAAKQGLVSLAQKLSILAEGKRLPAPPLVPMKPTTTMQDDGQWHYQERPTTAGDAAQAAYKQFIEALWPQSGDALVSLGGGAANVQLKELLGQMAHGPLDMTGKTAVVTGASPNSIALSCVRFLLRCGARVVVTTSTYTPERIAYYRELYEAEAALEAELHVVPFNQASYQDVDALVAWLFEAQIEQAGGQSKVVKRPFAPDLLLPFAAIKDLATLDRLSHRSHAVMRALLLSVERMMTAMASRYKAHGLPAQPMHVILPMSPNHGVFGGDGVYAEAKAALEVLCHKWHSERDAWASAVSLCAAKIGWVRGTGLMDDNNLVAAPLEETYGLRTFSSDEMGLLLAALCAPSMRELAQQAPLHADLTGGFGRVDDLKGAVATIREGMERQSKERRQALQLHESERQRLGLSAPTSEPAPLALPNWPMATDMAHSQPAAWPQQAASLAETVVIVGAGELGPCGSSRTRYALEVSEELAPAAVLELAWMTGLIEYRDSGKRGWYDVASDSLVPEAEIAERYRDALTEKVGIRMAEPEGLGFDPAALPVMTSIFLEKDLTFSAASEAEAKAFVAAAPEATSVVFDPSTDQWQVTRRAGTEIRVPRQARLSRQVLGMIPEGFDFARYGISQDMIDQIDRLTLFNLVATVDAFVSSGISPEELLQWVHPTRVANTQGSGIGGMRSLHRLYLDHVMGEERQGDQLQETLINVVAAHVVQSYIGSYGAMAHPVAACATAAVSLEEGMDKLRLGKADFVVTGGYDDLGREGMVGFSDMNATADSDKMQAMGLTPAQMSRGNDARRRGFVEAQGGGTILMTRGDIAAKMGLPVLGVLAYAASFGDGIHKSIPAPGLGALGAVTGGDASPMAQALKHHGLTADDIALVYKHDTSTAANDPNENRLHQTIQEQLGRTQGNPLFVVSQKSLTGHSKGGAAAWQAIGLCQAMQAGVIPGNRNLDCVDDTMREFDHMGFTNQSLQPGAAAPMRAGLLTSLGFGHVSGIALVLHPDAYLAMIDDDARETYQQRANARHDSAQQRWVEIMMGKAEAYQRRDSRRFVSPDGSDDQQREEIAMLLDPTARYDAISGHFASQGPQQ